jgi:hypothetical protein
MNPAQRKRAIDLCRRYGKQPTTWMGVLSFMQAIHPHMPAWAQFLPEIAAGAIGIALFVFDEDADK